MLLHQLSLAMDSQSLDHPLKPVRLLDGCRCIVLSSRLKLDHPAQDIRHYFILCTNSSSPVCPLLVQYPVTALLASDRVAALERDLGIAVTAEVRDWSTGVLEVSRDWLEGRCARVAAGTAAGKLRRLVCFA